MAAKIINLTSPSTNSVKPKAASKSFFSEYGNMIGSGLGLLANYSEYQSQKTMLNAQANMYNQNAANALFEGRQNVQKVYKAGEQAQGALTADYGASGVDVNSSQTVNTAQRTLQKGINDDVFSTMYSAASEANQQQINAQMTRYQLKQAKSSFLIKSASSLLGGFM